MDLDITNYDYEDILKLFDINKHFSKEYYIAILFYKNNIAIYKYVSKPTTQENRIRFITNY